LKTAFLLTEKKKMKTKISMAYAVLLILFMVSCIQNDSNIKYGYHSNKGIKFIKRYRNHMPEGQFQWFYENGTIEQTVMFLEGKESGNAYYYYEDGTLKNSRHWNDGKMVGYAADYYDDTLGIIKSILLFNGDGKLVYRKNYDKTGHLINEEGKKPEIH
jgi:antitoxin component YwqK of YwqJK toxin-antitoxin module